MSDDQRLSALQLAYKRLVDGAEGDGTSLTNAQCALLLDRFVYLEDTEVAAQIKADRDRYREALERIYKTGKGVHVEVAREALNG